MSKCSNIDISQLKWLGVYYQVTFWERGLLWRESSDHWERTPKRKLHHQRDSSAARHTPAGFAWSALHSAVTLVTLSSGNVAAFVNTLTSTAEPVPNPAPMLDHRKLMLLAAALTFIGMAMTRAKRNQGQGH